MRQEYDGRLSGPWRTSLGSAATRSDVIRIEGGQASAAVTVSARRVQAPAAAGGTEWSGWQICGGTPQLRGVLALNIVAAVVGSVVMGNAVNCLRGDLGRPQRMWRCCWQALRVPFLCGSCRKCPKLP